MMRRDRTGKPPEDGPRSFSSADSTEQRLRAEAALSREELQETITELVRRTDPRNTLRSSARRRRTHRRLRGRERTAVLFGIGVTACCAAAIALLIRAWSPCRR